MNAVVQTLAIIPPGRKLTRLTRRDWLACGVRLLRQFGPYAALELLLPGGSLLAILLWLYHRHHRAKVRRRDTAQFSAAAASVSTLRQAAGHDPSSTNTY